jgi:hypothetical protein
VHQDGACNLPQERDDERHHDEEHRILDGTFGLQVDVDRLNQIDAKP